MSPDAKHRYICPVTERSVTMPYWSTASPYSLMECSPDNKKYPECSKCDFNHKYSEWIPPGR